MVADLNLILGTENRDILRSGGTADHVIAGAGADYVRSGGGADLVDAGDGDDVIKAGGGHDIVITGAGSDYADDGRGVDTARYLGSFEDYEILVTSRYIFVTDKQTGDVDRLKNFERLEFSEGIYDPRANNNGPSAEYIEVTFVQGADPLTFDLLALANAFDFEGDTIEIVSVDTNSRLNFNPATGQVTYDPGDAFGNLGANQSETDSFSFTLSDGTTTVTRSIDITVQGVNDAPTGTVEIIGEALEDTTLSADAATLDDADGIGVLMYQWQSSSDDGATWNDIDGAGAADFVLGELQRDQIVRVVVSYTDDGGTDETVESAPTDVIVQPNAVPITNLDFLTVPDDQTDTLTVDVLNNDSDPDGHPLTISDVQIVTPFGGLIASATAGGSLLSLDFLVFQAPPFAYLQEGQSEVIEIRYTASDGNGGETDGLLELTVQGSNQAPKTDTIIAPITLLEDLGVRTFTLGEGYIDPEGGPLTVSGVTLAGGKPLPNFLSFTGDQLGVDTSAAAFQQLGPANRSEFLVSYSVVDDQGLGTDATFRFTVEGINDLPEGEVSIVGPMLIGQELTADASQLSDAEGSGTLMFQWQISTDGGGSFDDIDGATDATYSPVDTDLANSLRVVVTYTDDGGTVEMVTSGQTDPVGPRNEHPNAVDDAASVPETFDQVVLDVLSNDSDPEGQALTITAVSIIEGRPGLIVNIAGNKIQLDRSSADYLSLQDGQSETIRIGYTVSDPLGGESTAEAVVTVQGENTPPIASGPPAGFVFTEDTGVQLFNLIDGFVDPEGGPLTVVDVTELGGGALPNNISFTPGGTTLAVDTDGFELSADGMNSVRSFVFDVTLSDAQGATSVVQVGGGILGVNDAPESGDGSGSTEQGTVLVGQLPAATDPDSPVITYAEGTTGPANGAVVIGPDGNFTYAPDADFTGTDSFTFMVSDGAGGSSEYSFDVEVVAPNLAPITVDDSFIVPLNSPAEFLIPVLNNDSDPEGQPLTLVSAQFVDLVVTGGLPFFVLDSLGTGQVGVSPEGGGAVTYNTDGDFNILWLYPVESVEVLIDYVVTDGINESTGRLTVTVGGEEDGGGGGTGGTGDPPTVSISGPTTVDEGDTATYTITLSEATSVRVRVDYQTMDDTAVGNGGLAGFDYQSRQGFIIFEPGAALTQTISVSTSDDRDDEPNETFSMEITGVVTSGSGPSEVITGTSEVVTTIIDNDEPDDGGGGGGPGCTQLVCPTNPTAQATLSALAETIAADNTGSAIPLQESTDGNDVLYSDDGNDLIDGLAGDDVLSGRGGNDLLTGGSDADLFVFGNDLSGDSNRDTITDFTAGEDAVLLNGFGELDFATLDSNGDGILNPQDGLITDDGGMVFDFGNDNQLALQGIGHLHEDDLLFA